MQLGDGAALAAATGIDVVYDLRAADCAPAGRARRWRRSITARWPAKLPERPVVVLNIGGVANVTWIGRDGTLLAFDTGPGQCADRRLDGAPHAGVPRTRTARWRPAGRVRRR